MYKKIIKSTAVLPVLAGFLLSVSPAFAQLIGSIDNPTKYATSKGSGLFLLLSNVFRFTLVVASIFMVIQFILAGYGYLTAEGDPKKVTAAWTKIWQTILGFVIISAAFVLASLVSRLTGNSINPLNFQLWGPNGPVGP